VLNAQQQQTLAFLLIRLNIRALDMGQIFFGFQWIVIGYLILRSNFVPRILGAIASFSLGTTDGEVAYAPGACADFSS
jgi:hypothetical protein